jgi:hypothetical protein
MRIESQNLFIFLFFIIVNNNNKHNNNSNINININEINDKQTRQYLLKTKIYLLKKLCKFVC